jgi:hypothetical protein
MRQARNRNLTVVPVEARPFGQTQLFKRYPRRSSGDSKTTLGLGKLKVVVHDEKIVNLNQFSGLRGGFTRDVVRVRTSL